MKSVAHPDGIRRITMKMEAAVGVADMTLYALHMLAQEKEPVNLLKGCNKREIFALARASLQGFGQDTAKIEVPKTINPIELTAAEDHVRSVFPEID
jgi:hypothetical protein